MRGFGSQSSANRLIRFQVVQILAPPPQRAPPEIGDVEEERGQCRTVCRHCVVVEVAGDDLLQPSSLLGNRLMHAPQQFLFDGLQLLPHAVPSGLPFDLEFAPAGFAADEGEAQEGEGLRFAGPAPLAVLRRNASELDKPGLLRMKRQRKLL
jgi:hypothetical protein